MFLDSLRSGTVFLARWRSNSGPANSTLQATAKTGPRLNAPVVSVASGTWGVSLEQLK